jgi:hypothetical protein
MQQQQQQHQQVQGCSAVGWPADNLRCFKSNFAASACTLPVNNNSHVTSGWSQLHYL